jgi:2-(1,2-epoxy-1,2-dihydrophenyl)acetyl-CoA isomerase
MTESGSAELLSRADGSAHHLTLNRPHRRNALTPELAHALAQEIDAISELGTAQIIVLTGAGGHFCAGLDLHWLRELGDLPAVPALQQGLSHFQSAILAIARCPIPVIAALQGTVAGFGLDLALACDIRIAGASASFTSAFARMGLVPDGGSTFTLLRLTGVGQALRLLMTSETLRADAALRMGLVEEVVTDDTLNACVTRLIGAIGANDPGSLRAIKRLTRAAELGALEQALATEGAAQLQALQSPAFRQRLETFIARTAPAPPDNSADRSQTDHD